MKIVLFTINDTDYVPVLNEKLLQKFGGSIVKVYISKSFFSLKEIAKKYKFLIKNRYPFCIKTHDLFSYFKWKIIPIKKKQPLINYFKSKEIKASYIKDVNSFSFHQELKNIQPDIVIFNPFDKIVNKEFLSIPSIGTYNVHLGKLPEYKGGLSSFWVLRYGDSIAGATLHEVNEKIDAGNIIEEIRFKHNCKSMKELMDQTTNIASEMIVKGVDKIINSRTVKISKDGRASSYNYYPTAEDIKEFYKKGNRLI